MNLNQNQTKPLGAATRFLVQAGGAVWELAALCRSDVMGLAAIGATVIMTAAFAGTAVGSEVLRFTGSKLAAAVSFLLWGGIIFTVDRLLLAKLHEYSAEHLNQGGQKNHRWRMAVPRLLMICVISFIVSNLLLQKIFETSLNAELRAMAHETAARQATSQLGQEIKRLEEASGPLLTQLQEKEKFRNEKYAAWIAEAEGTAGSGVKGQGPLFKQKKAELDRAEQEWQAAKDAVKANQEAQQKVRDSYHEEVKRITEAELGVGDMLARNRALFGIIRRDFGALLISVMLMGGLILLESTSLTVELVSPSHEYIKLLANVKKADAKKRAETLTVENDAAEKEAASAKDARASFQELHQAVLEEVTRKLKNGEAPDVAGPLHEVANAYEKSLLAQLLAAVPPAPPVSETMTAQPASVMVRVLSTDSNTEDVGCKINFNRHVSQAHQVTVRDLHAALQGNNWDARNGMAPLDLSHYKFVTETGAPLISGPLFKQLGESKEVHLQPLAVPLTNDQIN